jgi:hypothetical protein
LAAKKRKRRKKSNPSYEAADRIPFLAPTFAISFPLHVLLRLFRFFAAKKDEPVRKSRSLPPAILSATPGSWGQPQTLNVRGEPETKLIPNKIFQRKPQTKILTPNKLSATLPVCCASPLAQTCLTPGSRWESSCVDCRILNGRSGFATRAGHSSPHGSANGARGRMAGPLRSMTHEGVPGVQPQKHGVEPPCSCSFLMRAGPGALACFGARRN